MDVNVYASSFLESVSQTIDVEFTEQYFLPGVDVTEFLNRRPVNKKITVSRGLHEDKNKRIIVTTAGILKYRSPSTYWIEAKSTHYTPLVGDQV